MEEDILLEGVLLKTRSSFVPVAQRDGFQIRLHNISPMITLHFGNLS